MKRLFILLLSIGLVFIVSFQTFGSPGAELSTSVYYDLDITNSDFAFLGGVGISVLVSSPINQNLKMYYGVSSGLFGLGFIAPCEAGIGTEILVSPTFSIEPMILADIGLNSFTTSEGVSGLIRYNMILSNKLKLYFSTGVKYLYCNPDPNYQFLFIPLEFGLTFRY